MQLATTEARFIWFGITLTFIFYFTGTLYLIGSAIGWLLLSILLVRLFAEGKLPTQAAIPVSIIIWILSMLTMLLALFMAHADFQLGFGQTVKSTIGWAKGWALLALFLFLGSVLHIKPQIITRSCCILASQAILFVPISFVGVLIGFDGSLYTSPLKAVGGPESTFQVNLFGINPETGNPRWPFFAPWAPAAGLISCLYLVICTQESDAFWRRLGIFGAFIMCLFCQSRAGWAVFILLVPALILFNKVSKPTAILVIGTAFSGLILLGQPLIEQALDIHQQIKDARPDSTRVRNDLATIALQRWESEAPIWGHGMVETGPKIVEFMPIGSHHSWFGLLFVKGIFGLLALAIPLVTTFTHLVFISKSNKHNWASILLMFVIVCYSFFENIEILAYLIWPALLWVGTTLNPLKENGVHDE